MLDNHIGYIAITEFAEPTEEQFMQAVNSLKDQGMESVIIDLRDNPGGYLTAVTEILDDILPEGLTAVSYTHLDVYKRQGEKVINIEKGGNIEKKELYTKL